MRRIETMANFRRFWYAAATLMGLASSTGFAQSYWRESAPQQSCPPARIVGVVPTPITDSSAPATSAPQSSATSTTAMAAPAAEFGALGGATANLAQSGAAYMDSAIPFTGLRLRFSSATDGNRPDRGEYFYGKCGCFAGFGLDLKATGAGVSSFAKSVDYNELDVYMEAKIGDRASVFVDTPVRWVSYTPFSGADIANGSGLSDIGLGFKYVLSHDACHYLTFQMKTTIPSGDASEGLGTANYSVEPAILFLRNLSDKLTIEAELRDWVAIGGTDFAGNVIRYGIGANYEVYKSCNFSVRPVAELVGWTFTSGKEFFGVGTGVSASGDTIVNAKLGVRTNFGDNGSFYMGYGRALTGEVFYKDIVRLEYRYAF